MRIKLETLCGCSKYVELNEAIGFTYIIPIMKPVSFGISFSRTQLPISVDVVQRKFTSNGMFSVEDGRLIPIYREEDTYTSQIPDKAKSHLPDFL